MVVSLPVWGIVSVEFALLLLPQSKEMHGVRLTGESKLPIGVNVSMIQTGKTFFNDFLCILGTKEGINID